jgi:Bardet-Biedl syndrome 5 protein
MFSSSKTTTKKASAIADFMWQDREVRFDTPISQLTCREGEKIIDSLTQVEDTKGNSG